jgi:AcrR family transcriptional regulator
MAIADRRLRERNAQRRLIIATARRMAEREGWDAVTTRRLATAIEYSQPVIYKHFASMDQLAQAVALEGFQELADALAAARAGDGSPEGELGRVAEAFRRFAVDNPALYDAMFVRATALRFGAEDTAEPLAAAFSQLRAAVVGVAGDRDPETLTEVFWAALHGLIAFDRTQRLRPGHEDDRIRLLVSQIGPARS